MASARSAADSAPKEVWEMIIEHLRLTVPDRSKIKERSQIRQQDLARMMCVSKLVNNVVAPLLYETVICDNLYGLFWRYTINEPVVPGICSKPELLRYTRHFLLEYPTRPTTETHDTYFNPPIPHRPHLVEKSRFAMFWGAENYRCDPAVASLIEAEWVFISYPQTQLQHSMPDLEKWSCGALFGTDNSGWSMIMGIGGAERKLRIEKVQKVFAQMYLKGRVWDYCQSGIYGPYSLDPTELHIARPSPIPLETSDRYPSSSISVPDDSSEISESGLRSLTVHINLSDFHTSSASTRYQRFESLPCIPGVQVEWCFDSTDLDHVPSGGYLRHGADTSFEVSSLEASILEGLVARHDARSASPNPHLHPFSVKACIPMSIRDADEHLYDGYVPLRSTVTEAARRAHKLHVATERITERFKKRVFDKEGEGTVRHPEDSLMIQHVDRFRSCLACDWTVGAREGFHLQRHRFVMEREQGNRR